MGTLEAVVPEPTRGMCPGCAHPVLIVDLGLGALVLAEMHEWEPRAQCQRCARTARRVGHAVSCPACGNSGYIGERRPPVPMLAIDVAWSDSGHIRIIQARTPRRRGEGLHAIHSCQVATQAA